MNSQWRLFVLTVLVGVCVFRSAPAQERRLDASVRFPPVADSSVARYTARRAAGPLVVDGRLDEPEWRHAERSPRFVDLISGQRAVHDTRAAVLWDDAFLYVGYWIEEPFVTAKLTERDQPIYQDNDVEFFLAGPDAYYEFEINAHGTIYEGMFIWQEAYDRLNFAQFAELDRSRSDVKSQRFGGVGYRNHPRGPRWAFLKWDFPGAQTAVHIDGTLNDNADRDRGWTVELAFPWAGMKPL
ncbi:MAG: carbohydrate-binding family 9-like protein, partial [Planctomycetaceae bacterium]|nr:carbohydrate-binding family 9-like protein [Planctomycetaceae bacterium]